MAGSSSTIAPLVYGNVLRGRSKLEEVGGMGKKWYDQEQAQGIGFSSSSFQLSCQQQVSPWLPHWFHLFTGDLLMSPDSSLLDELADQ